MTARCCGPVVIALLTLSLGACSTSPTLTTAQSAPRTVSGPNVNAETERGPGEVRPFRRDGKYGIRNAAGQVTIEPRYDSATLADTGQGLIVTQLGRKIGFVNGEGREITPPKYDSISTPKAGTYMVTAGGKSCAVDSSGREFLPCVYDSIFTSADPSLFFVMQNGKGRYVNRSGNETPHYTVSTPPSSPPATGTPTSAPYNRVRALAEARQWDNAIRAALSSTALDKIYVLLSFNVSSPNDMQRWPAQQVILENMRIFDEAIAAASPEDQRLLAGMKQSYEEHIRNQGLPPPSGSSPLIWSSPSTSPAPSVRTQAPRRCYQTSKTHQTCHD